MNTLSQDSGQIRLVLHEEGTVYSIGEPVRPKLQILNDSTQPIQFGHDFIFDWTDLAFAQPNAVHLVAPDGTDLAVPYLRDNNYFDSINAISIEAGKEEWLYLPIYAHFHLHEVGDYVFWLELLDEKGVLHQTNRIGFKLVDIEASVPTDHIELIIRPSKLTYTTQEPIEIEASFINRHDKPLTFLKPQQDSLYGWVNPALQFTVRDSLGGTLALARRSGTMAIPVYDATTQFTVAPGNSDVELLQLPDFPKMRQPGDYRVQLTYLVRKKAIGKAGTVLDREMNWSPDVFTGRIESNTTNITVTQ